MPDDYQQRTEANATSTAAQVAAVVAAYRLARIDTPELPQWVATTIRAGAARAVSLADRALSFQLATTIGRPVPAVGLTLPTEMATSISTGVATVVDESAQADPADEELENRLERLAKAAPLDAGQQAHQEAMRAQGVPGWTRQLDSDPCELCRALADGTVIPIRKTMVRHPGCSCVAVPVLSGAAPKQLPETGPDDPAEFVPTTLTTGSGIAGRSITRAAPGLTIRRSVFIPSRARTR